MTGRYCLSSPSLSMATVNAEQKTLCGKLDFKNSQPDWLLLCLSCIIFCSSLWAYNCQEGVGAPRFDCCLIFSIHPSRLCFWYICNKFYSIFSLLRTSIPSLPQVYQVNPFASPFARYLILSVSCPCHSSSFENLKHLVLLFYSKLPLRTVVP